MDIMKMRKALALLQAFAQELPEGDIHDNYIGLYHEILRDIRDQTRQDLDYFRIPSREIKQRIEATNRVPRIGGRHAIEPTYDEVYYCERARFLISLKGAINFINALTLDSGATTLPIIEPK
jgi:hypothetical protein